MLKVGSFPTENVAFADQTRWHDGTLEINREELLAIAQEDRRIASANVDIVKPGEKARIINTYDIVEPKVKVHGNGVVYPAVCGRAVDAVGEGVTHRLSGMAVLGCVDIAADAVDDPLTQTRLRLPWSEVRSDHRFNDMSGPGAVTIASKLSNVCITMQPTPGESSESWHAAVQSAIFRAADHLAQAVAGLEPPEEEVFDTTPQPGLTGVVFVPHLASPELYRGPYTKLGTAIYGITRAAPPWLLNPTEMLDGAISQQRTWIYTENPVVLELLRRHGTDWNFLACIPYFTNWSMQEEKQAASHRVAQMAAKLGADGAIVTTDVRGQRMVETTMTIEACEKAGVKTVFLTEEEDPEGGSAPPLITTVPELQTMVSTGTGGWDGPFPAVDRVVGALEPDEEWFEEKPAVHGRYGVSHLQDFYGYGRQSYVDY